MNAVNWRLSRLGRLTATAAMVALVALGLASPRSPGRHRPSRRHSRDRACRRAADLAGQRRSVEQATVGNTVYAGGSFNTARPPGSRSAEPVKSPVGNLMAYDITTGNRIASFNHILNAQVMTVAKSPDGSRIYVGGSSPRSTAWPGRHIAAFSTATGALITSFNAEHRRAGALDRRRRTARCTPAAPSSANGWRAAPRRLHRSQRLARYVGAQATDVNIWSWSWLPTTRRSSSAASSPP